ncbi:hypothetical protein FRC04_001546 [Tulasnella sp. 424]|nr:hypothetical protein FRC04_001546 [Tulasnella sp. 424]KAG8969089.1 hypothetical protein FRC05_001242 [Tulasnella sp. 425]
MHRVWAIEEVASNILCFLDWPDQARMARVCRRLWGTAIPLIWEELYDVSVFKTFLDFEEDDPDDGNAIKDDLSVPSQHRSFLSDRLALHSQFIRKMEFDIDSKTYRIVEPLLGTPSFRESLIRLRSLELTVGLLNNTDDASIIFRAFYTPNLTHIRIVVDVVHHHVCAEPFRGLVQAVTASHLPALRSLGLQSNGGTRADPFYLEEALRAHQQLESVEIVTPDCNREVLEILKNLPVLRTLELRFSRHLTDESPLPSIGKGFPHLISLDVRTELTTIKQLLPSIESNQVEVLKMSIYHDESTQDHRMDTMLEGLSRFKELKEVELQLGIDIIWEDIEPVLACRGLTSFSLISTQLKWIPIDRAHLDGMVQAWPNLSDLAITHAYHRPSTGSPLIKLADLVHLTNTCPSLRSLRISFDARQDGQEDIFALVTTPTASISPSRCPLELLDVGVSITDFEDDDNTQLGQLFTSWWPTLLELKTARRSKRQWYPVIEFVRRAAGVTLSP